MKKYVLIVTALFGLVLAGCGGKNARAAADSKATSAAGQEAVAEAAAGAAEAYLETAVRDAAEAALTAAAGWKPGDAGPQGGFIYYAEGGDYCEALPPEKAVGAGDPLPAGWVVPDMEDLALIYEAVQKSGAADYGSAWYISVNKSGGKNRYFRMSDGQETTGAAAGRKIGVRAFDAASVAAADGSAPPATVGPADPKWPIGGPGPNGGVVYSVGGSYMEVTRPDKAYYYYSDKPASPWRLPSPSELTQIRAALQTSGKADYGNYWYKSNKVTSRYVSKMVDETTTTFVRLKDGAVLEEGDEPQAIIYVRSFDPSQPPAKVAAGKPVAPLEPPPPVQLVFKPCPYPVGGKGPKGGVVYLVNENKGFTECTYFICEALAPANAVGPSAAIPAGCNQLSDHGTIKRAQEAGLKLENRWYLVWAYKDKIYLNEDGKWVEYPADNARLYNPVTGEEIETYRVEGEAEYAYKKEGGHFVPAPEVNAIVVSAPRLFSADSEIKAEAVRQ